MIATIYFSSIWLLSTIDTVSFWLLLIHDPVGVHIKFDSVHFFWGRELWRLKAVPRRSFHPRILYIFLAPPSPFLFYFLPVRDLASFCMFSLNQAILVFAQLNEIITFKTLEGISTSNSARSTWGTLIFFFL